MIRKIIINLIILISKKKEEETNKNDILRSKNDYKTFNKFTIRFFKRKNKIVIIIKEENNNVKDIFYKKRI